MLGSYLLECRRSQPYFLLVSGNHGETEVSNRMEELKPGPREDVGNLPPVTSALPTTSLACRMCGVLV